MTKERPGSKADKTTKAGKDAGDGGEDTTPAADDNDDVKRRFREALERKHEMHTDSAGDSTGRNGSKIRGTHGPSAHQRQFRRKSG